MLNDERETLGAALKYLGYSLNSTNEDEINEAAELVRAAKDRIATFDSDAYDDLLMSGETVIAHGFNGNFFQSFDEADAWETYGYAVPIEGGTVWVDNMAIPVTAQSVCTAHAFINFIMDAENGATLTNFNFYASPNAAAREFILPEVLEDPAIFPPRRGDGEPGGDRRSRRRRHLVRRRLRDRQELAARIGGLPSPGSGRGAAVRRRRGAVPNDSCRTHARLAIPNPDEGFLVEPGKRAERERVR